MRGISWLAAKPVSFSRRTLLHGVSNTRCHNSTGACGHRRHWMLLCYLQRLQFHLSVLQTPFVRQLLPSVQHTNVSDCSAFIYVAMTSTRWRLARFQDSEIRPLAPYKMQYTDILDSGRTGCCINMTPFLAVISSEWVDHELDSENKRRELRYVMMLSVCDVVNFSD